MQLSLITLKAGFTQKRKRGSSGAEPEEIRAPGSWSGKALFSSQPSLSLESFILIGEKREKLMLERCLGT